MHMLTAALGQPIWSDERISLERLNRGPQKRTGLKSCVFGVDMSFETRPALNATEYESVIES